MIYCYFLKKTKNHFSAKVFSGLISGIWVGVNEDHYRNSAWQKDWYLVVSFISCFSWVVSLFIFNHAINLSGNVLKDLSGGDWIFFNFTFRNGRVCVWIDFWVSCPVVMFYKWWKLLRNHFSPVFDIHTKNKMKIKWPLHTLNAKQILIPLNNSRYVFLQ